MFCSFKLKLKMIENICGLNLFYKILNFGTITQINPYNI